MAQKLYHPRAIQWTLGILAALLLVAAPQTGASAKTEPLDHDILHQPDKLIKYAHVKNKRATNGKRYDIKIQYGRTSRKGLKGNAKNLAQHRLMFAFTKVLISDAGKNDYKKPSADRLSELFPGSFVYTSIHASRSKSSAPIPYKSDCTKKKWHKSRKFTTYVKMRMTICNGRGFDTGHRAKIGSQMVVDGKL